MMLKKKIISSLLVLSSLLCFAGCGGGETSSLNSGSESSGGNVSSGSSVEERPEHLGLQVAEDGTLTKDGEPFYGFGVNYYGLINASFLKKFDVSASLQSLEVLASYDVRVIRFDIAGYFADDWNYVYSKKQGKFKDAYFAALDSVVDKAEELNIGLIPCFFWGDINGYFSEPANAWTKEDSQSVQFMKSFVEAVVTRYAYHGGIYGWEYSNETNLTADLGKDYIDWLNYNRPDGTPRTEEDVPTSVRDAAAMKIFADSVNKCDPYKRMIGNGDAEYRPAAYNLMQGNGWKQDTQAEHEALMDLRNRDMTAISLHKYYANGVKSAQNPTSVPAFLGYYDDWQGFMRYFVAQGKRTKKAVYLGEAGWDYADATVRPETETISMMITTIIDAAVAEDMPLTLFWNYDERAKFDPNDPGDKSYAGSTEKSWNENWEKGVAIMNAIKEGNRKFDEKHPKA